jgi:GNAT superfamily N-acetyltransferase
MGRIELVPARPEDREILLRIYRSTREEELATTDWGEEQKRVFVEQQFSAQDAYYREYYVGARFDLMKAGGEVVGRLYVDRDQERFPGEIRLMEITLLPEHRGRGLGAEILHEMMEEARAAGRMLTIHVERFNRALSLYFRLGFRQLEDKGVYLLLGWSAEEKPAAAAG